MVLKRLKFPVFLILVFGLLWSAASGSELKPRLSAIDFPVKYSVLRQPDDFNDMNSSEVKKEKKTSGSALSKTKAVALSLLLPGAGQYYAGAKGRAEVFIGLEVMVWASVLAFHTYGDWKQDDYVRYAERHAGIDPAGKDDDFYKNLTFYDNRNDYNTAGRIINPSAPYYPATQTFYWQWESSDARLAYRSIRNASKTAFRKATFMIGMAVFNRIVSGIDSFRIAKKLAQGGGQEEGFSEASSNKIKFRFNANPFGRNPAISLKLSQQF